MIKQVIDDQKGTLDVSTINFSDECYSEIPNSITMTPTSAETGNFILSLYHTILYRDRITYKCPLNESNTIECTVEQKAIISGKYILTQFVEEGSLNYIQLSDPVYLKFDFYPFVKDT